MTLSVLKSLLIAYHPGNWVSGEKTIMTRQDARFSHLGFLSHKMLDQKVFYGPFQSVVFNKIGKKWQKMGKQQHIWELSSKQVEELGSCDSVLSPAA